MQPAASPDEIKVPVVEEVLVVGKEEVVSGAVTLHKRVLTNTESVAIDLREESISVDRVAIERYVDEVPEIRSENGVTIIPVVKEVVVVEKKLMLVEELHIKKNHQTKTHREEITLRQEQIDIERTPK